MISRSSKNNSSNTAFKYCFYRFNANHHAAILSRRYLQSTKKLELVTQDKAHKGRPNPLFKVCPTHVITGQSMYPPFPKGSEQIMFAMGCFWSSEKIFFELKGVISTQVGYSGGFTPNPTYEEICSNLTGHTEVVRVVFDPKIISCADLLKLFWENHNPCQGMQQVINPFQKQHIYKTCKPKKKMLCNNSQDLMTIAIYCYTDSQLEMAKVSKEEYQKVLSNKITTEIAPAQEIYYAEDMHQQFFYKNAQLKASCSMRGTGVQCPIPFRPKKNNVISICS
ncbi:methionine-S-sulfoxide reductase [Reticulomyxa filosa]|uniref:peptide-methionine (S)-S-oxide reductase n=1 Tax=Reticulomyxa filosa TaxID=46433 RepID=X6N5V9_RETFI|nr:methionine-S-sulfoxide reductase [Reticulomyxa filosa]|eukprot:ETO21680.1 methionine-S-sulfoxide reductase [Reticulomyxa filosa]